MTFPTMAVQVAFGSDPFDAVPVWSNITNDVRRILIKLGRQDELDRMESGTCTIELDNARGDYWPLNVGGSYSPDVLPGKRININATYSAVNYDLYTGFAEAWTPSWLSRSGGRGPLTKLRGADIIKNLSRFDLNTVGYAAELSGIRVDNVLDDIGWPSNSWVTPNSHDDPGAAWTNEANAYDDDTGTFAHTSTQNAYLELAPLATLRCGKVRIFAGYWKNLLGDYLAEFPIVAEVYYKGAWHEIYDDDIPDRTWTELDIGSVEYVEEFRVKYKYAFQALDFLRVFEVDFESTQRYIDDGQSTMQATGAIADVKAMTHLFDVQKSELGIIYQAGIGSIQFEDRHHRLKGAHLVSQATFGDDVGEQHYHNLEPEFDDEFIYNDIRMTRIGGSQQSASDATSQTAYGTRTLSRTGLLLNTDVDAQSQADYLKKRYKDPSLRPRRMDIKPERSPDSLWPKVLGYDISTRITLRLNEASIDHDYFIEGIRHDINFVQRTWKTTWLLSDADEQAYWILEVVGFSELELTTWLAY